MAFTFFTLGGLQFWEDIFYYQKWRVQRNCFTNKCRLLDHWNIRRHSGTYEECRSAFEKYKDIYQLPRQKGPLCIMIHGLGGTKSKFDKMRKEMEKSGIQSYALSYASTRKDIHSIVKQVDTLLNNLDDIGEVSFITNGIGGLIIRYLLNSSSPWTNKIKVRSAIQINPPNRECKFWDKLKKYKIIRWTFGPILEQYDSKKLAKVPVFPKKFNFVILRTYNPIIDATISIMPRSWQDNMPKKDDAFLTGAKDAINVKIWKINSCSSLKIINSCISFLKKGKLGI